MSLHQRAWLRTPSFTSANSVDLNKPVWMASYFMLHLWTVKSHSIKFLPSLNFAIIVLESHVSIQIKCWNDIHQLSWQRFQVLLLSQLYHCRVLQEKIILFFWLGHMYDSSQILNYSKAIFISSRYRFVSLNHEAAQSFLCVCWKVT